MLGVLVPRMVKLDCPFPSCSNVVENDNKEIGIALFNAHVCTHTSPGPAASTAGGSSSRSEKLTRPKLSQRMLEGTWNFFLILRNLYKFGAALLSRECGLELIYCCDQPKPSEINIRKLLSHF